MRLGGSYGEALLKILDEEKDSGNIVSGEELLEAVVSLNTKRILTAVHKLPAEREAFRQILEKLRYLVRDVLAYRVSFGNCEFLFDDSAVVPSFAERISLGKLLTLNDIFYGLEKDFIANPNVQNLKSQLYVKLCNI